MKKTLYLVAGARPNFMKIAPIVRALQARPDVFDWRIVHTGQHYDCEMSDVFFEELGIPKPDFHLEGPVTADEGINTVVGVDSAKIVAAADAVLAGRGKTGRRPQFWDGRAAERIVETLAEQLARRD